jgi:hypothetical protein
MFGGLGQMIGQMAGQLMQKALGAGSQSCATDQNTYNQQMQQYQQQQQMYQQQMQQYYYQQQLNQYSPYMAPAPAQPPQPQQPCYKPVTSAQPTAPTTQPQTPSSQKPSVPVVSIIANPLRVRAGEKSAIVWAAAGATSCSLSDSTGIELAKGNPDGRYDATLATTTVFAVGCSGSGGSATSTIKIEVQ